MCYSKIKKYFQLSFIKCYNVIKSSYNNNILKNL